MPKGTKIGHTGTLDPLASGLMILILGRATRLSRYVTGLDKSYVATARFGAVSDTLDAEGRITPLQNAPTLEEEGLRKALGCFTGEILQTPPMASAVKVGGERLYKALRRGETVERESRPVTVHAFELLTLDRENATFRVSCSSGTYVRTLVSDLASSLDTGAYLTALQRTSVGHMTLEDATPPEDLTPETLFKRIIQIRDVVAHLPGVEVSVGERFGVCNGRPLGASGYLGSFRVEAGGELLAIYRDEGDGARAEVVLCDP
ncbi:MAG: tRNA pseudouridine(55) synthase [uncultured Rubrobacteraceae bacterium]|uniref:tRNA pseudouridine synthase B n=1 Tax=uncultured Rubrobacteraceae bacterium TaxID=349277 RepID=A0A6J4PPV7_9ACTN|nr:MAG: tRNA pseudouridine(55) synthase [uncultured Rubrobacteraceae bacterium]